MGWLCVCAFPVPIVWDSSIIMRHSFSWAHRLLLRDSRDGRFDSGEAKDNRTGDYGLRPRLSVESSQTIAVCDGVELVSDAVVF